MTARPARAVALDALGRVEEGAYSNVALPSMLRAVHLPARDRAFVTELVYGTLRSCRALDWLLEQASDRPLSALDAPVRAALRLGTYQLVRGVAAHAAVGETVAASPGRARAYVNAVLRRVATMGPDWPWPDGEDPTSVAVRLSYPDWIVERLAADLGLEDARAALEAMNEPAMLTLRVNPRRATRDELASELRTAGVSVEPGTLVPSAVRARGVGDPVTLPAVREGRATPQDEASTAVVAVLDPQPGERVLDACAAPGGKSTAAAERMADNGTVVAIDVRPSRLGLVRRAAARLDLDEIELVVADSRAPPAARDRFDRVLVDAPCSGLGVLQRRPEARWRVRAEAVPVLARLQRELLTAAAELVRPGGVLVYSACTLTRDETLDVDAWMAETRPELIAEPPVAAPWRPWGRGALLLPQDAATDGMFVVRFRRVAGPERRRERT